MASDEGVVVATIAFGMGIGEDAWLLPRVRIDNSSQTRQIYVRYCMTCTTSDSMLTICRSFTTICQRLWKTSGVLLNSFYLIELTRMYSQEVGRAGRDGLLSTCLVLLAAEDIPVLEGFARGNTVNKISLEVSFS